MNIRSFFNFLVISGMCVSMQAAQKVMPKLPQKYAEEVGQRLIQALKNYDGDQQKETNIHRLLTLGPDVHVRDEEGNPPFIVAARNDKVPYSMFKALHTAGFDSNARDAHGNTALMEAVEGGRSQVTSLMSSIFTEKASWGAQSGSGESYISSEEFKAYKKARKILLEREEVVAELVEYCKAHVGLQNDKGETALLRALKCGEFGDSLLDDAFNAVIFLLIHCNNVNTRDREATSALMLAVKQNNIRVALRLLDAGAKLHFKNQSGATAFYFAAPSSPMKELLQSAHNALEKAREARKKRNMNNVLMIPGDRRASSAKPMSSTRAARKRAASAAKSIVWQERQNAQNTVGEIVGNEEHDVPAAQNWQIVVEDYSQRPVEQQPDTMTLVPQ